VRTSFSNKTEPCHTSILTSVLTSMLIFPVAGCASHNDAPLLPWPAWSPDLTTCYFFSYGVTSRIVCTCPLCHVIYHSCDKGSWRQSLLSTARCCSVCGRNLITEFPRHKGWTYRAAPVR